MKHPRSFDLAQLRAANVPRCRRWHPDDSVPWETADWSNATLGEAGEAVEMLGRILQLANTAKKVRRHETGARNTDDPEMEILVAKLADEIADTVIYADLLAAHLRIDLGAAIVSKFNRTSERYGYPESSWLGPQPAER